MENATRIIHQIPLIKHVGGEKRRKKKTDTKNGSKKRKCRFMESSDTVKKNSGRMGDITGCVRRKTGGRKRQDGKKKKKNAG